MIIEIVEPDGRCHWKMQCEHGVTECYLPENHEPMPHGNQMVCERMRR